MSVGHHGEAMGQAGGNRDRDRNRNRDGGDHEDGQSGWVGTWSKRKRNI